MLLSNTAIFEALDDGRLIISPEPFPRNRTTQGPKSPYDSTAVDLTLGNWFSVPKENLSITIDVPSGSIVDTLRTIYQEQNIPDEGHFELKPNHFVLSQTREKVTLAGNRIPKWNDKPLLAARVEGKSSFARCGLLVHFTAPTIHCGFSGTITLEIICLGKYPVKLKPGMAICQLLIEEVLGDPAAYQSQFHGQSTPAGPK